MAEYKFKFKQMNLKLSHNLPFYFKQMDFCSVRATELAIVFQTNKIFSVKATERDFVFL